MGLLTHINHWLNFCMPALGLAALMLGVSWLRRRKTPLRTPYWGQFAMHAALGVAVLVAGLFSFGVDGKMATYAVLAVTAATVQWVLERPWAA
jgi:hypothetical protein